MGGRAGLKKGGGIDVISYPTQRHPLLRRCLMPGTRSGIRSVAPTHRFAAGPCGSLHSCQPACLFGISGEATGGSEVRVRQEGISLQEQ